MSRLAVLADIHGNLPALEAVLADLAQFDVDQVIVAGDVINWGPFSAQVLGRVAAAGWAVIRGNNEDYLLDYETQRAPAAWSDRAQWPLLPWLQRQLDGRAHQLIAAWPDSLSLRFPAAPPIRVVHGSPRSHSEAIYSISTEAEVTAMLAGVDEPVVITGHTHLPLDRVVGRWRVFNPGSVGVPLQRVHCAEYLLLESDCAAHTWRPTFRQVALDPAPVLADDTEIFSVPPIVSGVKPNILIVLDNSANWSASFGNGTKFSSEIATLSSVIGGLSADFNVGLMMAGETGSGNSSPVSTYVRFAVRNTTAANRAALQSLFLNMDINGDKTNNAPYGFGLYEVFKYFGGGGATLTPQDSQHFGATAYGGFGQRKRDFAGNAVANTAGAIPGNAFASAPSSSYVSPITDSCQRTYVVVISNGLPQSGADSGNPSASALLRNVGGDNAITTIPLSSSTAQGNIGDEYARFLYQTDVSGLTGKQNIVTYTINVYDADHVTGNDNANIALLRSMASQGHGRYFAATSTAALEDALNAIFNEVQSVNTVFASVTLPVSVNVRGTNLNQVYMGMFRATSDGAPRWLGNLKEFQLGVAGGSVFLADQSGRPAESPVTGFIVDNAVSFWTSASSFWSFLPSGNPPSASDSPDGPVVEKGGVAQRIRSLYPNPDSVAAQTRKIFTCTDSCLATPNASLATYPFNTVTIDPSSSSNIAAFGASGSTEVASIINWVRGQDNEADENVDGSLSGVRASVHGDVLHSRPAVVNYNRSDGNNDVVVYYGANDGLFRAVKGGQNSSDGFEKWAFVPKEFYGRIKRLRDNSPAITAANPKHYFADGPVGLYQRDANNDGRLVATDGDKVHLFMAMRRGGRMIYALDVSDPDIPKFMWQRDNNSPGYGELGQSWSEPKARKIRASANPVLIFGAGYDPAVEDLDPVSAGLTNTMGRGIFVVDAVTGAGKASTMLNRGYKHAENGFHDGVLPLMELRAIACRQPGAHALRYRYCRTGNRVGRGGRQHPVEVIQSNIRNSAVAGGRSGHQALGGGNGHGIAVDRDRLVCRRSYRRRVVAGWASHACDDARGVQFSVRHDLRDSVRRCDS